MSADKQSETDRKLVTLGKISGLYGVQGWVKVYSDTDPMEGIVDYTPWKIRQGSEWQTVEVSAGRKHGKTVVAKIAGIDDRETAAGLIGAEIAVERGQLPPPEDDEYYWTDLEGLSVITIEGRDLGRVDHLFETGSNDVMVVNGDRQRLVPFILEQVIRNIDLEAGRITVDWDPEF